VAKLRVLVYGAGGHARVVIDVLERMQQYEIVAVADDDPAKRNHSFCGYPIIGGIETVLSRGMQEYTVAAIGDNKERALVAQRLESTGFQFVTAIHPAATIGRDVSLGHGTVIMANAAVNPNTTVGRHAIINTGATVDHDCLIGDFAHISPGAHLGGNVTIEALVHVGIGASVIPGVRIGKGSIIGAGAAVVTDIPSGVVAVGVPAKVVKPAN